MAHASIGSNSGGIQSRKDYKNTPAGQFKYWHEELSAAAKRLQKWLKEGDKVTRKYIGGGRRNQGHTSTSMYEEGVGFRLNLFHSNIVTLQSMLYGNTPKVDVSRRNVDANDDVGRVAAEMMERMLNNDLADNGEEYDSVLRAVLEDRLLPGLGCARVRYEFECKEVEMPGVVDEEGQPLTMSQTVSEDAPIDYYHWRDVVWGWGRTWAELPWVAFRSFLDRDEITSRFSQEAADAADYQMQNITDEKDTFQEPDLQSAWAKAEVWEVWDKSKKKVVWIVKGFDKVADTKKDPLKLKGFYPCPPFLLANPTTSLYIPTSDYSLAQDLYNEIDVLQTRISIITEAVRVVGVYDSSADGIKRMFKEGIENELIPVDNWAIFAEKGGIQGSVVWVPLADIVGALDKLRELRDETIGLIQQVTGMSDIMRGELGGQYEGVGQSQLKAKFGSVRVQALQDAFAKFAGDLMQIKAEIISKHFDPETIAKRSNMQYSEDAEVLMEAIKLLKNPTEAKIRVTIRPESVAMVDYAMLKSERTEYLTAISTFMQSASPLMEADPEAKPFLLKLLQWGLAGFKGANEIEGVVDKAIQASQEAADKKKGKPDPEQQRQQMEMQKEQVKLQGEMQKIQAKAQADMKVRMLDLQADIDTGRAEHESAIARIKAELQAALAEITAKTGADIQTEVVQSQVNAEQQAAGVQQEIVKDVTETQLELEQSQQEHEMALEQAAATAKKQTKED